MLEASQRRNASHKESIMGAMKTKQLRAIALGSQPSAISKLFSKLKAERGELKASS